MIVNVDVPVDTDVLWGNMMGGHSGYWAENFETLDSGIIKWYKDDNYEQPNPQDFKVLADGEWHEVTIEKLARAYVRLKLDGWNHCGHYGIEDEDSCTGDALLQIAAFGEFIYG